MEALGFQIFVDSGLRAFAAEAGIASPPKGATSIEMLPVLRPTIPNSSASPTRHERLRSCV